MEITITGDPEDVVSRKTDSAGRINLGTDFADRDVTVLVVDSDD